MALSAGGAAVVIATTFGPWYAVSVTPAGIFAAQQQLNSVAHQYGNSALQSLANEIGLRFSSDAHHHIANISAHQSLKYTSAVLLMLAGAALLAVFWRFGGMIDNGGGVIAAFGVAAGFCVIYRMVVPPNPAAGYLTLSLSWGSWLALVGAAAVAVGGMTTPPGYMYRPNRHPRSRPSPARS